MNTAEKLQEDTYLADFQPDMSANIYSAEFISLSSAEKLLKFFESCQETDLQEKAKDLKKKITEEIEKQRQGFFEKVLNSKISKINYFLCLAPKSVESMLQEYFLVKEKDTRSGYYRRDAEAENEFLAKLYPQYSKDQLLANIGDCIRTITKKVSAITTALKEEMKESIGQVTGKNKKRRYNITYWTDSVSSRSRWDSGNDASLEITPGETRIYDDSTVKYFNYRYYPYRQRRAHDIDFMNVRSIYCLKTRKTIYQDIRD